MEAAPRPTHEGRLPLETFCFVFLQTRLSLCFLTHVCSRTHWHTRTTLPEKLCYLDGNPAPHLPPPSGSLCSCPGWPRGVQHGIDLDAMGLLARLLGRTGPTEGWQGCTKAWAPGLRPRGTWLKSGRSLFEMEDRY